MNDLVILRKRTLYIKKDFFFLFNVELFNHYIKKSLMYTKSTINVHQLQIYNDKIEQVFKINGEFDVFYYKTNNVSITAMRNICQHYGIDGLLKFLLYEDYGYIEYKDKLHDFYYRLKRIDPKNDLLKVIELDKSYLDEYYLTYYDTDKLLNLPYFLRFFSRIKIDKLLFRVIDV